MTKRAGCRIGRAGVEEGDRGEQGRRRSACWARDAASSGLQLGHELGSGVSHGAAVRRPERGAAL